MAYKIIINGEMMRNNTSNIPHITNSNVLTIDELSTRWSIPRHDILYRIHNEELQSIVTSKKYKSFISLKMNYKYLSNSEILKMINPLKEQLGSFCDKVHSNTPLCLLQEHIWPYEDLHPELKAAAQKLYEKTFPSAPIWDSETDGKAVKDHYAKAPLDPENQQRDILAYFLHKEGFTLPEISDFLTPGQRKESATVSGWKKSGELILNRLHENKKIK